MASGIRKLYIARCPKCNEPLKEISYVPVYRCGSCNAILLANCWKTVLERVTSENPKSISAEKNFSSSGGNSNRLIPDSRLATYHFTSDAVSQVQKKEAERKIDVDNANDPSESGSCARHITTDHSDNGQLDNEESSYLKDVYTVYDKQDKESLSSMPFGEHMPRIESDNRTGMVDDPCTSLSNEDSSCLQDVYTAYNEQGKESLPPDPISECIIDVSVGDGGHNMDGHQAENSAVNNDSLVGSSDHNDASEVQADICLSNETAMDIECPDVHVNAFNVSYPDDKCGNCMFEGSDTLNFENLECDTSQKWSTEYISNVRFEHYLNAAVQAETLTGNNEDCSESTDDTDISEKILAKENLSNGATVSTESPDIRLCVSYGNVSSSSDRCRNLTSEEPETRNSGSLECNPYDQRSPQCIFYQKVDKGKNLKPDQVETSLEFNEQSVAPFAQKYKSEELPLVECFPSGVVRQIESSSIHFDAINGNVTSDDQCTKHTFGEHESWNIEKCNPYQQIGSFDHIDNDGPSLMMHQTTDNKSICNCSGGEADFIDFESSTTSTCRSTENIEEFQESISSISFQQVPGHNINTEGTGNTKPAKQVADMCPHEEENGSAEKKVDIDDANGPFGCGSYEKHIEGDQSHDEDSSYLKDVYTSYSKQDKEPLFCMSFDEHMTRDESDNTTRIVDDPLRSLRNEDLSCLKDVYTAYIEQDKESRPPSPIPECIFDRRVEDGEHNLDCHPVENSAVNNDISMDASDQNVTSEVQSDIHLHNETSMDVECPNFHVYALSVSYPDDACGNCMSECTDILSLKNFECNSSQKRSPEYISNGRIEDKGLYSNAAGQAETLTENEEFVETFDDSHISEKVLVDESLSSDAIVNTGSPDIHLPVSYGNVSSSTDRCGNPTSEEPETRDLENLECDSYEQCGLEHMFDGRKYGKGKSLDSEIVEVLSEYNEQSVMPSVQNYKSEEGLVDGCCSNGVIRKTESPNIDFGALNEEVSSDGQRTKCKFGEHDSWSIEKQACNPRQKINLFDSLDNNGCSLMMHNTTDSTSIGDSGCGSNFCDRIESDFDIESSSISLKNTGGFQESNGRIVIQHILGHNFDTRGTGNTKSAKVVVDMYPGEEKSDSSNESDDCLSSSDPTENSTSLIGGDNHDEGNDEFTTALPEIVEEESCNVFALTDGPCQASRTTIVEEFTDLVVFKEEKVGLKTEISEEVSLPIHALFHDREKNRLQENSDAGQGALSNSRGSLPCLVDCDNSSNKLEGEFISSEYPCNEVGHENPSILCDQVNNSYIHTIFGAESSRLVEETAESSTHFFIPKEDVHKKLDNQTDTEMEPRTNMYPNAETDMSKERLDTGQYILDHGKESVLCSIDAMKTHIGGEKDDRDQFCSSFSSEGCIDISEQRISSISNAVGVKTSKTIAETIDSSNLVIFQGGVVEQDLDSAKISTMEHPIVIYSNSHEKKTSGNELNIDQHTLRDENVCMQFVAASCGKENLTNNELTPSSSHHYYSSKGFNNKGGNAEYNRNAILQSGLDGATLDKENLGNDVLSPSTSTHCFSIKEGFIDKEEDNKCNGNHRTGDSEYNSMKIPISSGENYKSIFVLSNQEAIIEQDVLSWRSQQIQCPHTFQTTASEKESDRPHITIDNDNEHLSDLFISTTTDRENENDDEAVTSSILCFPVSKHAFVDKPKDKANSDFCEQTEYQEDNLYKSEILRPIEDSEETYGHFTVTKEAPDLSYNDESAKHMTLPNHHSLLSNQTEESTGNPCVLKNNDFALCLNDGKVYEYEKKACSDVIHMNSIYGISRQIDTSNCVSNGIRALRLTEEEEEFIQEEARSQCIINGKVTKSVSSNSINSDAHGEILPSSDSGKCNQTRPENLVFQEQERFSSKEDILNYGSDYNEHGLKDEPIVPNKEAALGSPAADANDINPGIYLEEQPSEDLHMLKSEQITENIEASEAYSKLNKQVDSFDNQPSITVSHKPMEVTQCVQSSSGSRFFTKELTDVNLNTTRNALSPTCKSSLDHGGCFSSADEVYWNQVLNQRRGRRTPRPRRTHSPLADKERNKGVMDSTINKMSSTSKLLARAKTRLSSKLNHTPQNLVESLSKNGASWPHRKKDSSGSSEEFYSADNRTASESEVPEARSLELATRKLISKHHNSSRHPKSRISEGERRELVRKIDEVRSQLIRSHDQPGGYSPTFARDTQRMNQQPIINRHRLEQEQFLPSPSASPASQHLAGTIRSIEKVSENHMVLQMSSSGKINCYLNQRQAYNQFINGISPYSPTVSRQERVQHTPSGTGWQVRSPSSPFSCYASPKREYGTRNVQLGGNHQTRKQHCRPILGGAQFIICNACLQLLTLPEDFQISTKNYKLRCGSCSEVLEFSLIRRTHIVPRIPKQS